MHLGRVVQGGIGGGAAWVLLFLNACATGAPSARPVVRTVFLEVDYSLAATTSHVEIHEGESGQVWGRARVRSGDAHREINERAYDCHAEPVDDRGFPEWLCPIDFARGEPEWRSILSELDDAGLMNPPKDPPAPAWPGCLDGAPWSVLVIEGDSKTKLVEDRQACPPAVNADRRAYEAVIEGVIDRIFDRAWVKGASAGPRRPLRDVMYETRSEHVEGDGTEGVYSGEACALREG